MPLDEINEGVPLDLIDMLTSYGKLEIRHANHIYAVEVLGYKAYGVDLRNVILRVLFQLNQELGAGFIAAQNMEW